VWRCPTGSPWIAAGDHPDPATAGGELDVLEVKVASPIVIAGAVAPDAVVPVAGHRNPHFPSTGWAWSARRSAATARDDAQVVDPCLDHTWAEQGSEPAAQRGAARKKERDMSQQDTVPGAVVRITEVVGNSPNSFSDAVRNAVAATAQTVRGIRGVEVVSSNADVDENGNLSLYKVNCKIAFVVERGQS